MCGVKLYLDYQQSCKVTEWAEPEVTNMAVIIIIIKSVDNSAVTACAKNNYVELRWKDTNMMGVLISAK